MSRVGGSLVLLEMVGMIFVWTASRLFVNQSTRVRQSSVFDTFVEILVFPVRIVSLAQCVLNVNISNSLVCNRNGPFVLS